MRINRVHGWPVPMRLSVPYAITYETVEQVANVDVRVVRGRVGVLTVSLLPPSRGRRPC